MTTLKLRLFGTGKHTRLSLGVGGRNKTKEAQTMKDVELEEVGLLVSGLGIAFGYKDWYSVVEYCHAIEKYAKKAEKKEGVER